MLSLGYLIADWLTEHVPLPGGSGAPWTLTDEQVALLVRWYRVDDRGGMFAFRRGAVVMPKGWGKSPLGAGLCIAELAGPVVPDGLDARGEPVGRPWGTGGTPPPWLQVAGVSEDAASSNVFVLCFEALEANGGKAAADLGIDSGRTRLFRKDSPGSRLEAVTSSSGSREGQRLTFAIADETDKWLPANGGPRLARTLRRNAAKVGGRVLEFANAFELGEGSVAELTCAEAATEPAVLYVANTPTVDIGPESEDAEILAALDQAYGNASWVDRARILAEVRDAGVPWSDSRRFYLNLASPGGSAAVDARVWADLGREFEVPEGAPLWAGFVARDGAALVVVVQGPDDRPHLVPFDIWEAPRGAEDWRVPRHEVHDAVRRMFSDYAVQIAYFDPSGWRTELEVWAEEFGEDRVVEFPTNSRPRMGPAVDRLTTAIAEGQLSHANEPDLSAHMLNAIARRSGDHTLLAKAGPSRSIDAALAAAAALQAYHQHPAREVWPMVAWM